MANPRGNPQNLTPGNFGNRGGGRFKNEVREALSTLARDEVVPYLQECMKSEDDRQKAYASDRILRYGVGEKSETEILDAREDGDPGRDEEAILLAAEAITRKRERMARELVESPSK